MILKKVKLEFIIFSFCNFLLLINIKFVAPAKPAPAPAPIKDDEDIEYVWGIIFFYLILFYF